MRRPVRHVLVGVASAGRRPRAPTTTTEPAASATGSATTRSRSGRSTSPRACCSPRSTARRWRHAGFHVERAFAPRAARVRRPGAAGRARRAVPEYAGTALEFASLGAAAPSADAGGDARASSSGRSADVDVVALAAAPAQNANTFVVTRGDGRRLRPRRAQRPGRGRRRAHLRRAARVPDASAVPGRPAPTCTGCDVRGRSCRSTPAGR